MSQTLTPVAFPTHTHLSPPSPDAGKGLRSPCDQGFAEVPAYSRVAWGVVTVPVSMGEQDTSLGYCKAEDCYKLQSAEETQVPLAFSPCLISPGMRSLHGGLGLGDDSLTCWRSATLYLWGDSKR